MENIVTQAEFDKYIQKVAKTVYVPSIEIEARPVKKAKVYKPKDQYINECKEVEKWAKRVNKKLIK